MSDYTPGPWIATDRTVTQASTGKAVMLATYTPGLNMLEECQANARMAARAPDCVVIARMVVAQVKHGCGNAGRPGTRSGAPCVVCISQAFLQQVEGH